MSRADGQPNIYENPAKVRRFFSDGRKHRRPTTAPSRYSTAWRRAARRFGVTNPREQQVRMEFAYDGGGRDQEKIIDHVLEADRGYLARLAWKNKREGGKNPLEELNQTRQAILDGLEVAVNGELPERDPRGGIIWPARYFVRRVAWHVLDHVWEIEDRIVEPDEIRCLYEVFRIMFYPTTDTCIERI